MSCSGGGYLPQGHTVVQVRNWMPEIFVLGSVLLISCEAPPIVGGIIVAKRKKQDKKKSRYSPDCELGSKAE